MITQGVINQNQISKHYSDNAKRYHAKAKIEARIITQIVIKEIPTPDTTDNTKRYQARVITPITTDNTNRYQA